MVEAKAKTPQKDENSNPSYQGKPTRWIFATRIDAQRKKSQEYESIRHTLDSFKKDIVAKGQGNPFYAEEGFLRVSLLDFYLNENSSDW